MKGYINLNRSTTYTGQVITVTQDSGSYVYSPDIKGWIDKKALMR